MLIIITQNHSNSLKLRMFNVKHLAFSEKVRTFAITKLKKKFMETRKIHGHVCRVLKKEEEFCIIGPMSLWRELWDLWSKGGDDIRKKVNRIDNMVYYYTDDVNMNLCDSSLKKAIRKECPDII